MKQKSKSPLTTAAIAYRNLTGKPGRAAALVIVVAIMAFVFFGGSVLSQSLDNGIRSLEARLGADIAVVPPGSESAYQSIILAGAPINFYFDRGIEAQVANIAGVEQVTTQFYLATLADAECCTIQTQIIGIDYDTDFAVTPWIAHFLHRQIGDGEVIVGSNVAVDRNNTVTFFGRVLNVAARLERTATGMDYTVYVNMGTALTLAQIAQAEGFIPAYVDIENAASTILVNVIPGYEIAEVLEGIRRDIPYIGLVASYGIYASIATNLRFFTGMISTITVVLGIFAVLILAVLFSLIAGGRKKEFAILRILGATRKKLASVVLAEASNISLCGAVFGSILAALVVFPFGRYIGVQMGMPLLLPGVLDSARLFATAFVVSVAVGPLASAYSAYKISRAETYATMREGE